MLYEEFLMGTGAKATKSNYEVYKAVEAVYNLHPTMEKEDAYELAKPMIDNELTPEEALLEYIEAELMTLESIMENCKESRRRHEEDVLVAADEDARKRALDRCHEDDLAIARNRGKRRALKAITAHILTGR